MAKPDTKNVNLFEITRDLQIMEERLIESGGEITPDMESELAELESLEADKLNAYYAVIRRMKATAKGYREELDRLQSNAIARENAAKALMNRILDHMRMAGRTEIQVKLGKFKETKNSVDSVIFKGDYEEHPEKLPKKYQNITVAPNRTALADAIKAGNKAAMKYATVERGTHLRMY